MSNEQLAKIDPLVMNLLVAKGIPSLAHLEIASYQETANQWATEAKRHVRDKESRFHAKPDSWKNDVRFFRLTVLAWYIDAVLGIRYREDQRDATAILYTDPSDLFLNGVMDTRRGTCGNMAALFVALSWRLGWPVSLACVGPHFIARYDDGKVTHNIEITNLGIGGVASETDAYYHEQGLPQRAVTCGSDLRAVTPRELLGLFFGGRARHYGDTFQMVRAEQDYLWARALFPLNRYMHMKQVHASTWLLQERYEPNEIGHPDAIREWLTTGVTPVRAKPRPVFQPPKEIIHEYYIGVNVPQRNGAREK